MKKFSSIILLLCLILSGCGTSTNPSIDSPTSTPSQPNATTFSANSTSTISTYDHSVFDAYENDYPLAKVEETVIMYSTIMLHKHQAANTLRINQETYDSLTDKTDDFAVSLLEAIEENKKEANKSESDILQDLILSEIAYLKGVQNNQKCTYEDAYSYIKYHYEQVKIVASASDATAQDKEPYEFLLAFMNARGFTEAEYLENASNSHMKAVTSNNYKAGYIASLPNSLSAEQKEEHYMMHLQSVMEDYAIVYYKR